MDRPCVETDVQILFLSDFKLFPLSNVISTQTPSCFASSTVGQLENSLSEHAKKTMRLRAEQLRGVRWELSSEVYLRHSLLPV